MLKFGNDLLIVLIMSAVMTVAFVTVIKTIKYDHSNLKSLLCIMLGFVWVGIGFAVGINGKNIYLVVTEETGFSFFVYAMFYLNVSLRSMPILTVHKEVWFWFVINLACLIISVFNQSSLPGMLILCYYSIRTWWDAFFLKRKEFTVLFTIYVFSSFLFCLTFEYYYTKIVNIAYSLAGIGLLFQFILTGIQNIKLNKAIK